MTSTNVLENLITVEMLSRQWESAVFNDAEEVGTELFLFYSDNLKLDCTLHVQ